MRSFGTIIKAQRRKLGLTQKQVADFIGVTDAYICGLERDKKSPPPYSTVAAIAEAIHLDEEWLWSIAAKHRERYAVERSNRKITGRRMSGNKEAGEGSQQDKLSDLPDSQINAFFDRTEIQMTTFGLFRKYPQDMTMEEKRFVYRMLSDVQKFVLGKAGGY